jgi:hypothetical protein
VANPRKVRKQVPEEDTEQVSGGIVAAQGAVVADRESSSETVMPGGIPEPVDDDSVGGFYNSKAIFPDTQAQFKVHIIDEE